MAIVRNAKHFIGKSKQPASRKRRLDYSCQQCLAVAQLTQKWHHNAFYITAHFCARTAVWSEFEPWRHQRILNGCLPLRTHAHSRHLAVQELGPESGWRLPAGKCKLYAFVEYNFVTLTPNMVGLFKCDTSNSLVHIKMLILAFARPNTQYTHVQGRMLFKPDRVWKSQLWRTEDLSPVAISPALTHWWRAWRRKGRRTLIASSVTPSESTCSVKATWRKAWTWLPWTYSVEESMVYQVIAHVNPVHSYMYVYVALIYTVHRCVKLERKHKDGR